MSCSGAVDVQRDLGCGSVVGDVSLTSGCVCCEPRAVYGGAAPRVVLFMNWYLVFSVASIAGLEIFANKREI